MLIQSVGQSAISSLQKDRPNHVAIDETVNQLDVQRYWLYSAVNPETNEIIHVRLLHIRTIVLTKHVVEELHGNHHVENIMFLVNGAPWPKQSSSRSVSAPTRHPRESECDQRRVK